MVFIIIIIIIIIITIAGDFDFLKNDTSPSKVDNMEINTYSVLGDSNSLLDSLNFLMDGDMGGFQSNSNSNSNSRLFSAINGDKG